MKAADKLNVQNEIPEWIIFMPINNFILSLKMKKSWIFTFKFYIRKNLYLSLNTTHSFRNNYQKFFESCFCKNNIAHKWSSPLSVSSVNVTKSAVFCGFGQIYWKNPHWKASVQYNRPNSACFPENFENFYNSQKWKNVIFLESLCQKTLGKWITIVLNNVYFRGVLRALSTIYEGALSQKQLMAKTL